MKRLISVKFKTEYPLKRHRSLEKRVQGFKHSLESFVQEILTLSENSFVLTQVNMDREILQQVVAELVNPTMNEAYMRHYNII